MKIFVLSLLRLGDLIQQEPLLLALREKYPQAQIHLGINRQFASIADVFKVQIDQYHLFDRDFIQRSLGEAQYNLFSPFDLLERFISEINEQKFDLILNWTHNRLSASLMGTLHAQEKLGLQIENSQVKDLESRWLKYLNDHFAGRSVSHFHYAEILSGAFQLKAQVYEAAVDVAQRRTIFFQCLTSDSKKNWPLKSFAELKKTIEKKNPEYKVKILAALDEVAVLSEHFVECDIVIASLSQMNDIWPEARLLVSGDTSIKHLAARSGVPTLEISMGGSTPVKTGAFSQAANVILAKSPCYPCSHSEACPQNRFLCHESVSAKEVYERLNQLLQVQGLHKENVNQFERLIWKTYLDNAAARPAVKINLSASRILELEKQTDLLMAKQIKFESCEDFNLVFSSLQRLNASGVDSGAYFQKLGHVFKDRYANAESAFRALKEALLQSRELIQIRRQAIENVLSPEGKNAE